MKKILSIILAAMMVLGMLAGCTGNNTETQQPEEIGRASCRERVCEYV